MSERTNEWQTKHPWEPAPTAHPEPVPLVKQSDLVNPFLTIGEVMSRDIPTCRPDIPLTEAARNLRQADARALFVLEGDRPVGFLFDRALAWALADLGPRLHETLVRDVMNRDVPTVAVGAKLEVLLDHLPESGLLAVDSHGRVQGVVRWHDLPGHLSERALGRILWKLLGGPPTETTSGPRKG